MGTRTVFIVALVGVGLLGWGSAAAQRPGYLGLPGQAIRQTTVTALDARELVRLAQILVEATLDVEVELALPPDATKGQRIVYRGMVVVLSSGESQTMLASGPFLEEGKEMVVTRIGSQDCAPIGAKSSPAPSYVNRFGKKNEVGCLKLVVTRHSAPLGLAEVEWVQSDYAAKPYAVKPLKLVPPDQVPENTNILDESAILFGPAPRDGSSLGNEPSALMVEILPPDAESVFFSRINAPWSGGIPLVDRDGQLVSVVFHASSDGKGASAVPTQAIRVFIGEAPDEGGSQLGRQ